MYSPDEWYHLAPKSGALQKGRKGDSVNEFHLNIHVRLASATLRSEEDCSSTGDQRTLPSFSRGKNLSRGISRVSPSTWKVFVKVLQEKSLVLRSDSTVRLQPNKNLFFFFLAIFLDST